MTTVIELYGAPCSGKSTFAAGLFYELKKLHLNAELVREYVKDWMYINRKIDKFDELYILGKQLHRETIAYDKVDYLITDCPVWLAGFYEKYYYKYERGPCVSALLALQKILDKNTKRIRFLVNLTHNDKYSEVGRVQKHEEALKIQDELIGFLDQYGLQTIVVDKKTSLEMIVKSIL